MRKFYHIIVLATFLTITACISSPTAYENPEENAIPSLSIEDLYNSYETKKRVKTIHCFDMSNEDTMIVENVFEYDEMGVLIQRNRYQSGGFDENTFFEYDDSSQLSQYTMKSVNENPNITISVQILREKEFLVIYDWDVKNEGHWYLEREYNSLQQTHIDETIFSNTINTHYRTRERYLVFNENLYFYTSDFWLSMSDDLINSQILEIHASPMENTIHVVTVSQETNNPIYYTVIYYDDDKKPFRSESFIPDATMISYSIFTYENEDLIRIDTYQSNDELILYRMIEWEDQPSNVRFMWF